MTNNQLTREENVQAVFDLKAGYTLGLADVEILKRVARMALAAMDSEPRTDDELSNLLWFSQEATCHSDPNYFCEFQRLAAPGLIAGIIRELQERLQADSEPVAEVLSRRPGNDTSTIDRALPVGTQLYRHAQQPLVPENAVVGEMPFLGASEGVYVRGWNDCRAAMLQELPKSAGESNNCRSGEIVQVLQGEWRCSTKSAPALDSLPKNTESRCGNSPVIPDGYVMVPKEPTDEMIAAAMNCDDVLFNSDESFCVQFGNIYKAMLAAAPQPQNEPQNIPEIIPQWIPVSERMPERGDYLVTDGRDFDVQSFDGEQFIPGFVWEDGITHWMPLPAVPQEVSHG